MENEKGTVKLTRKQLYDEIWALSVAGVARKYNLNYGKLIATCKVENISFPSSGYWTKAFSFTPNEYISIHKKLFAGIYGHAGKLRDYNITKKGMGAEWSNGSLWKCIRTSRNLGL